MLEFTMVNYVYFWKFDIKCIICLHSIYNIFSRKTYCEPLKIWGCMRHEGYLDDKNVFYIHWFYQQENFLNYIWIYNFKKIFWQSYKWILLSKFICKYTHHFIFTKGDGKFWLEFYEFLHIHTCTENLECLSN